MDLSHWVTSIVAFVRAGYPSGMPVTGYVPLVALTRRRLGDDDITAIATDLIARRLRPISPVDIGVEITRITNQLPSPTTSRVSTVAFTRCAAHADKHRRPIDRRHGDLCTGRRRPPDSPRNSRSAETVGPLAILARIKLRVAAW